MFKLKKDIKAFTVNTGEFNIQVDENTSQEDLEKVAALPEYEGLIVQDAETKKSTVQTAKSENKVLTKTVAENGTEKE